MRALEAAVRRVDDLAQFGQRCFPLHDGLAVVLHSSSPLTNSREAHPASHHLANTSAMFLERHGRSEHIVDQLPLPEYAVFLSCPLRVRNRPSALLQG